MTKLNPRSILLASTFVTALAVSVFTQTRAPFLQDIQVQATPAPTPALIQKTGSSTAANSAVRNPVRTLFPALADVTVPGISGILIETMEGNVVAETNSDGGFNPASNVKIATAFAVLKTFGPDYRFATGVYTDGTIDPSTGTLNGNVYVTGRDPMFGYQHGVALANELNKLGIRSVTGALYVTDNFSMNYSASPTASANALLKTANAGTRSAAASRNWISHISYSGQYGRAYTVPSVNFAGNAFVLPIPSNVRLLFIHESAPMREILKATLCYSNNFLSERLGDMLGGPYAVARLVHQNARVEPAEFSLATSSGLGYNRVTPNAMMKLLRALRDDLARYKMTFMDIMPVAGVDKGTLEGRFDTDFSRGSLVGKTGTLGNTDGGVSSLAGEVSTRNGKLLFVIFNQRGSVARFRAFQNFYMSLVQGQFGGAAPMKYDAVSLDTRLARTRVSYPTGGTVAVQ